MSNDSVTYIRESEKTIRDWDGDKDGGCQLEETGVRRQLQLVRRQGKAAPLTRLMSVKMASRQPVTLMTREYTLIILSKILLVLCILLKNDTSFNFSS